MPQNFEDMYNSLRRLHNSSNIAVDVLQEKIKTLNEELILSKEKLNHAQDALDINKQIMRNALEVQNKMQTEYAAEIELLKAEIRELKKIK